MIELCSIDELANDTSKGFITEGVPLFVVRKQDQVFVYLNSCPHRLIPLEWQPDQFLDYDKNFIQCASHGALFKIDDGTCIAGPCSGDSLTPIPHETRDGTIWVELPQNT